MPPSDERESQSRSVHHHDKLRVTKVKDSEAGGLPSIKNEQYFHGFIPIFLTPELLVNVGDFLVRQAVKGEAKSSAKEQFIISVRVKGPLQSTVSCSNSEETTGPATKAERQHARQQRHSEGEVRHILMKYSRRARIFHVHRFGFRRASGLIEYHKKHNFAIDDFGTMLEFPIKRTPWQLNHEQIVRSCKLGDGAFGDVFMATLKTANMTKTAVAVKTVNGVISHVDNEKLFQEAMLMKRLRHMNIIHLVGVASNEDPLMVVMEFAPGGSVKDAVKKDPLPSLYNRVYYCLGAAKGLSYLESHKIIHRDIAARNVLIGADGEAKISDFGLSLVGSYKKEKALKKVPIRYLSPETLKQGIYTHKSDVWSYGVYVWEVFHNGVEPFEAIEDLGEVRAYVIDGGRPSNQSTEFPLFLWSLVSERCWLREPDARPHFKEIRETIEAQMEPLEPPKPIMLQIPLP